MKTRIFTTRASLAATATTPFRSFASLLAGSAVLGASSALAGTWVGTAGGTDWNVGANWNDNTVPNNSFARIDKVSPICTISSNLVVNPSFIVIANGAVTGRLDHVAGTASTAASQDIQIGRGGGTGTYNLANTAGRGGTLTGFAQGSGSMNVLRHVYVGGFTTGATSNGTLNLHTSGTLAISNQLLIGNTLSTGTVRMDSGTLTVGDAFEVGNGPGTTGFFSMSGGTVTKAGGIAVTIGGGLTADGGTGTATLNGGTFTCSGVFRVGQDTIATSVANSTGTLNLGGTQLTVNGEFWIGNNTGASGTMTMSAGSLTTNNWALIGRKDDANTGAGATGSVTMTGGTWTKTGESNFVVGDTGTGTMNMSGGLVIVTPHAAADRGVTWIGNRNNATGTLTISGTAEFRSTAFALALQAGTNGTLNLNGGTVKTSRITGGTGTDSATFNGTQLVGTADSATFIANLDTADIGAGGLLVDSGGFTLTAPQVLDGTGGVVKTGTGTFTLTGGNTYAGSTMVAAGKLAFSSDHAGTGNVTVADGAALGVIQVLDSASLNLPNLTLGTSADTSLDISLGNSPGNPSAPALNVTGTGTLTLNGTVAVNITDAQIETGSFPVVTYAGTKAGSGSFVLGSLPDGVNATLNDNGTGTVTLNVTSISFPRWSGDQSGVWDTVTQNWTDLLTSLPTLYADPAPVVFDDGATGTTTITLDGPVAPAAVAFNQASLPYSLTGTGKITGDTGLTKTGGGDLTLGTANDYTGPTVLSGGTTSINSVADAGSPSSIGAAASPLGLGGGLLNYTGPNGSTNRGLSINGAATVVTTATDLGFGGPVTTTAGSLVKQGTGNLIFSHPGANVLGTVGNGVLVHAGTLTLGGAVPGQTNVVSGEMWVADLPDSPASLILNNTTLTIGSWLAIGRGNGNDGVVNLTATNSTINTVNYSTGFNNGLANNASEAFVTLTDTVWNNNGLTYLAESTGSAATMTLNGNSQYNITSNFLVARFGTATATFTLSDTSSVNKTGGYVAIGNEGVGIMNVGDSASFNANNGDFNIGDVGSSNGTLNLSGLGSVNVFNVYIGKNITTTGTLNQTGGTFQSGNFISIGAFNGGTGTVNISAGSLIAGTVLNVAQSGNGTLNVSGTAAVTANGDGVFVGSAAGGNGTLNLDGGTVTTKRVAENTGGFSTVNFNGGLLKAGAGANASFVGPIDFANILSGGAFIDTSGQSLSVTAGLSGSGGLTKQGTGTLTLSGVNSYAGNTTVSAGTLSVTSAFFANGSIVSVAPGAILNLPHGATDVVGGLTIGGTPLATGTYDSATHPGIITGSGKIQVAGGVASPYDTWMAGFPSIPLADRDPGDDPDKDGDTNAMEFALGGTPNNGGSRVSIHPILADSSDGGTEKEMLLTIAVRTGTPAFTGSPSPAATHQGYTYTIQGSTTLGTFNAASTVVNPVTAGLPAAPSGYEYRTFSLTGSDGTPSKGFLRVNITP